MGGNRRHSPPDSQGGRSALQPMRDRSVVCETIDSKPHSGFVPESAARRISERRSALQPMRDGSVVCETIDSKPHSGFVPEGVAPIVANGTQTFKPLNLPLTRLPHHPLNSNRRYSARDRVRVRNTCQPAGTSLEAQSSCGAEAKMA